MEKLLGVLEIEILGNTLQRYLMFLVVFLGLIFFLRKFGKIFLCSLKKFTQKTSIQFDDFILEVCEKNIFPLLYAGSFYLASKQLIFRSSTDRLIDSLMVIVLAVQGIRLAASFAVYFLETTWLKKQTQKGGTLASKSVLSLLRVIIWGVGLVFLLDNLGFNVSAIVAGLGIGGIAVALAAQTILGDLFNYFVILFDRPFREGDFIVVGDFMGEIENIGVKSTRIRSLGGEEVIVSNSNLTSSRIRNYRKMSRRRAEFVLRVSHQTALEKVRKIPPMIREIIQKIEGTKFERAHFKEFTDAGLLIEAVYYVLDTDFNKRMDIQQEINLAVKEAFEKEGIKFV